MKFTNKFDLPECFERFNTANAHSKDGAKYSVTEIIDSPFIPKLRALHASNLEVDISERIMALLGTAVHNILEDGAPPGCIVERRMSSFIDGASLSGQIDLMTPTDSRDMMAEYRDGAEFLLSDYKTCRGIALKMSPEGKSEWVEQLNSYAFIASDNGYVVSGLEVVAIVRDWNAAEASRSEDYPQQAVVRIPIPLWDIEKQYEFLSKRVQLHEQEVAPPCTPSEMWERPTQWAVHKKNKNGSFSKRAFRVCSSRVEADTIALSLQGNGKVVKRRGGRVRCEGNYCNVSEFCPSWNEWNGKTDEWTEKLRLQREQQQGE